MPNRYSMMTATAVKEARASIALISFGISPGRMIEAARAKKTP